MNVGDKVFIASAPGDRVPFTRPQEGQIVDIYHPRVAGYTYYYVKLDGITDPLFLASHEVFLSQEIARKVITKQALSALNSCERILAEQAREVSA